VYFIDLYVMEISATSGGLPSGLASLVQEAQLQLPPRKPLRFGNSSFFSTFYFLLFFQKGDKTVNWANKRKNQEKASVHDAVF